MRRLMKAISVGATRKRACGYAGISHDTFERWMRASASFAASIQKAEDARTVGLLDVIKKAARSNWTAAARLLEATTAGEFTRGRQEISGPSGGPVPIDLGETRIEFMDPVEAERHRREAAAFFRRNYDTAGAPGTN